MRKLLKNTQGFTLLEVIVVLLVLSILGATLAPPIFKTLDDAKEASTKKEMEVIYQVIYGDPDQGIYGYIGDMGGKPDTLDDLNTQPVGSDAYTTDPNTRENGIGIGWNGPYLNLGYSAEDYLQDAWGRDYIYDSNTGQIKSLGSDGADGTADDLLLPPYAMDAGAGDTVDTEGSISVIVSVYDTTRQTLTTVNATYADVDVYYASNGTQTFIDNLTYSNGVFYEDGLHYGYHAVEVTGKDVFAGKTVTATAVVSRGATSINVYLGAGNLP